ncbi:Glycosyltransferase involved in cell wall bisynthesis [Marinospirillum celere]|uniref:Glycosyltransferase involved in cell wall bisynthesis n=1 Tax=Marinospirillum celere TaxID=1122252 RepID=A0A1I1IEK1_9GAMM|nr:glycosyltransferase family 4 protein [Marinospirillum celere]SFC32133.1 Glycosyltransferase involved in cell wall bisynthesis [Marinospirillum celere]
MRLIQVCLNDEYDAQTQQVELLIHTLAEKKIKQQVVCKKNSVLHHRLKHLRNLHLLPVSHRFSGHYQVPKTGLIHAHDLAAARWAGWQRQLRGNPWLMSWHSADAESTEQLNSRLLNKALAVIVTSFPAELAMRDKAFCPVRRIPDAAITLETNPMKMTELRSHYQGRFVIGHWGHIEQKFGGQLLLVKCAERMQADFPNMVFVILGEGPDYQKLKNKYKDRENIDWVGEPKHPGDYYSVMNLFIDPANRADSMTGLLQAMSFHIPVIASKVSGFAEFISHRSNGMLFKKGDVASLEEMIKVLYNSTQLRTRLTRDANRELKEVSADKIALKHLGVYQALIKSLKAKSG